MPNLTSFASGSHLINPADPAWVEKLLAFHAATFGAAVMEAAQTGGEPAPAGPPATETQDDGDDNHSEDEKLREAGLKALQKERDARKAAEAKAAELAKQIEDAGKTEAEKQAEALKTALSEAQAATAKALKFEVAAELGLDLKLASRLVGSTREELLADGEELKGQITATGEPKDSEPKQKRGMGADNSLGGGTETEISGYKAGADRYDRRHQKTTTKE